MCELPGVKMRDLKHEEQDMIVERSSNSMYQLAETTKTIKNEFRWR
tara:strand:+ start:1738 stop:1875 length:138 start_codon:yes stop_codon:yes gene_type:complete